jgi:hypothetical protein
MSLFTQITIITLQSIREPIGRSAYTKPNTSKKDKRERGPQHSETHHQQQPSFFPPTLFIHLLFAFISKINQNNKNE